MTHPHPDLRSHAEHGLMQGFPPPPDKLVTAENGLWGVPYNRWSYQNMRSLLPSVPIVGCDEAIQTPRRTLGEIDAVSIRREDGSQVDIETFLSETYTDSMLVVKGDEIVWERHLNGMTARTPHQMMSCTKSFIGLFALTAVRDQLMSEADLVPTVLPELAESAFATASLGQVLDMTSSMQFSEEYDDPDAQIHEYAALIGLGPKISHGATDMLAFLATLEADPALGHDEVFHYQTPKTDAVNWMTSRVTGRSAVDAFGDLWKAMGAGRESYLLVDGIGTPIAGGGLNATPEDLARFLVVGLDHGLGVIGTDVLESLERGGSVDAFLAGPNALGCMENGHWSYRGQWWVRTEPGRESIGALGVNGQWIYLDRARGVGIVKMSSQPVAVDTWYDDYTVNAFDAVIDAIT